MNIKYETNVSWQVDPGLERSNDGTSPWAGQRLGRCYTLHLQILNHDKVFYFVQFENLFAPFRGSQQLCNRGKQLSYCVVMEVVAVCHHTQSFSDHSFSRWSRTFSMTLVILFCYFIIFPVVCSNLEIYHDDTSCKKYILITRRMIKPTFLSQLDEQDN